MEIEQVISENRDEECSIAALALQSTVPLKRLKTRGSLGYSWSFVFSLPIHVTQNRSAIAADTVALLQQDIAQSSPQARAWKTIALSPTIVHRLEIKAQPSGLILLNLGEQALFSWLDSLLCSTELLNVEPLQQHLSSASIDNAIFLAQHSHTRCCSLLRLLDREGYIVLTQATAESIQWQLVQPASIPWSDAQELKIFSNPTSRNLLHALFSAVDEQHCTASPISKIRLIKQLTQLTEAFQVFYRTYPLLHFASQSSDLQCYTGLLLVSQRIFYSLLTALGEIAPSQL